MKTTVSFQGPQGSGKTVLSRAFREFLSARGVPVTLLDPDDRRDAADNFSVEVETDDLLARLEALQAQPVGERVAARNGIMSAAACVEAYGSDPNKTVYAVPRSALKDIAREIRALAALTASPPVGETSDE